MKKIIFKKELCMKDIGLENNDKIPRFVDYLDGKQVDLYAISNSDRILPFILKPEWCQEFDDLDSEDVNIESID